MYAGGIFGISMYVKKEVQEEFRHRFKDKEVD